MSDNAIQNKPVNLMGLKLMIENNLLTSAEIKKNKDGAYYVVFYNNDHVPHIFIKDRNAEERTYKSIDRLISSIQEIGYDYDFKLSIGTKSQPVIDTNIVEVNNNFRFLVINKVNHVLDSLETHIKHGRDFNYDKDMTQVQTIVKDLHRFVSNYKT